MSMTNFRKYLAEFIGTAILVLIGCGSAATTGGGTGVLGVLGIAAAFGLTITVLCEAIGDVSGCHINPAVSLACLMTGRMDVKDFIGYVVAQFLGAITGALLLLVIITCTGYSVSVTGLGTNGYGDESLLYLSAFGAVIVEIILTFIFVFIVLSITASEKDKHYTAIIIGIALAIVHIFGVCLTGTSVNPARSFGPALIAAFTDLGTTALLQVWVFILAPLLGAALAAVLYMFLYATDEDFDTLEEDVAEETVEEIIDDASASEAKAIESEDDELIDDIPASEVADESENDDELVNDIPAPETAEKSEDDELE